MATLPEYPVYVPTKGRWKDPRTARGLNRDGCPFYLVVEPQEAEHYEPIVGEHGQLLVLPFSNLGQGSIPARNWIRDHAEASGAARHWQLDDNVRRFYRLYRKRRVPCPAGIALRVCEVFTDRYENVGISGLNYEMFGVSQSKPFLLNVHVYSITLVNHAMPCRWRGRYNEDTDLCLQALSQGWCTVLLNAFLGDKQRTLQAKGGNTDELYADDGRLQMARELERNWPGVVTVIRRFGRPQHLVNWRRFDTPLRLKEGIDLEAMPKVDDYGMQLQAHGQITHPRLLKILD